MLQREATVYKTHLQASQHSKYNLRSHRLRSRLFRVAQSVPSCRLCDRQLTTQVQQDQQVSNASCPQAYLTA